MTRAEIFVDNNGDLRWAQTRWNPKEKKYKRLKKSYALYTQGDPSEVIYEEKLKPGWIWDREGNSRFRFEFPGGI